MIKSVDIGSKDDPFYEQLIKDLESYANANSAFDPSERTYEDYKTGVFAEALLILLIRTEQLRSK